jgi:2-C-methyl-D-erythritol 4-phosphate cytidylyltransferase
VNAIALVVVVVRPVERDIAQRIVDESRLTEPVVLTAGGASRLDSELAGLDVVRGARLEIDVVAIHDGARPFATAEMFEAVIAAARSVGGGVPALSSKEPLFSVVDAAAARLQPGQVVAVQTPQAFRREPLLRAYDRARTDGFDAVDTAQTVERYGKVEVAVAAGDRRNLKITYASELAAAEAMVSAWAAGRWM